MTTCSESGQVRKEAAIRSLCRASESIERAGAFWCRGHGVQEVAVLLLDFFAVKEARFPGLGKRASFVSGFVDWRR